MRVKAKLTPPIPTAKLAADESAGNIAIAAREAIQAQGCTQADVAKAMGVSRSRISQILSGDSNCTLLNLHRLAEALGLELEIKFKAAA